MIAVSGARVNQSHAHPADRPRLPLKPRTLIAAVVIGSVALPLVLWPALRRFNATLERTMHPVPTPEHIYRHFPELRLRGAAFAGTWGEIDRGSWLFELRGVASDQALRTLRGQLQQAGWHIVRQGDNDTLFHRRGSSPCHLLLRPCSANAVELLIINGGIDLQDDPFARRVIEHRWRTTKDAL